MITVLAGDNSFEVREALKDIESSFGASAERVDGSTLELRQLPDLLMGSTLFAEKRLVVISDISLNKSLWEKIPDWLPRISDDIHVVLVDVKPDKRTTSYKALKEHAEIREFPAWTERDLSKAENWVGERAKKISIPLDYKTTRYLVNRVGPDQWRLAGALELLSLFDTITPQIIDQTVVPSPSENVFQLFETALEGNRAELNEVLRTLELQEDPYALFALLSSQVFTLAALAFAGPDNNPSKDFAVHPFVAQKLTRHANKLGKPAVSRIVTLFAQTDADMKISKADPWILLERLLFDLHR